MQLYDAVTKGDIKQAQQMVSGGLNPSEILLTAQGKQSALQVIDVYIYLCMHVCTSIPVPYSASQTIFCSDD
jgi:hypothetical protein